MIRDLTLSLRELLTHGGQDFPELAGCRIAFDRPGDGFNPAQPTISLFLHDLRENTELRSSEPDRRIVGGQATLHRAPFRLACSYLVTAWPGNLTGDELALQEQLLLGQVLATLLRYSTLPAEYLVGTLAGQDPPLPLLTAQAEGLRNASEFWTSLNNRMRPSLNVTATLSLRPNAAITGATVASSEIRVRHAGANDRDSFRIGGRVTSAANDALVGATVSIVGTGLSTVTDATGRFVLAPLAAGGYSLRVHLGSITRKVAIRVPAASVQAYDVTLA